MPSPFLCARCGAPLALPQDRSAVDVLCTFCHARTPVPLERLQPTAPVRDVAAGVPSGTGRVVGLIFAGIALLVALGVGLAVALTRSDPTPAAPDPAATIASAVASALAAIPKIPATPSPRVPEASPPTIGTLVRTFGGKGTGAGLWSDARTVAVDPDGFTYVGEYMSGRVMQYDPAGKFARVIDLPKKDGHSFLFGLAADWAGSLVVSRSHEVLHLSRKDFSVTATVREIARPDRKHALPNEICAQRIAVDAKNEVYALSDCTPEGISMDIDDPHSLVKLDARGRALAHWKGVAGDGIAADGDGTVFLGGRGVSVYDATGKLVTRWGHSGKDPGDFPSPFSDLAVDGHGHVLVLTWTTLQMYDAEGKYLGLVAEVKGGRALAVGANGHAYVVGDDVKEYAIAAP